MTTTKNCYYCGQEITFDDQHVTAKGKHIPLNAGGGNVPHDCAAKPRQTNRGGSRRIETEDERRRWTLSL